MTTTVPLVFLVDVDDTLLANDKIHRRNRRDGIFEQIREVMLLQSSLSIERMCQLVPVSRRSF
jgi:hypothetical protein